jgi:hypothetical protein
MKTMVSAAFSVALIAAAWPSNASGQTNTVAGPIGRSIEREEAKLLESRSAPLFEANARSREPQPQRDWSRVGELAAGTEIIVTTRDSRPEKHRLLHVEEGGLKLLSPVAALPAAVRGALVDTARNHPEYLIAAQRDMSFQLTKDTRLTRGGVFVGDNEVADLDQVIATVARSDVVEISVLRKHVGSHARRGALIGAAVGAIVLGVSAASCRPGSEPAYCNVPGMAAVGALGGGVVGLEYGFIVGVIVPRSPDVIYRAN